MPACSRPAHASTDATQMTSLEADDRSDLRALADLCGRLLLREANAADLELLQRPDVEAALSRLGVDVPHGGVEPVLHRLASEYRHAFLREGGEAAPLASNWQERSSGDAAAAARSAAMVLGVRLPSPADHIGALLVLWARADLAAPDQADLLRTQHLAWGIDALQARALDRRGGFYAQLAGATLSVLVRLTGRDGAPG